MKRSGRNFYIFQLITHPIKQPSPRFWKIESYEHMFGDQIEAFIEKRTIMSKRSVNIEKRGENVICKKWLYRPI